jgi:uncharacterized protein YbcI
MSTMTSRDAADRIDGLGTRPDPLASAQISRAIVQLLARYTGRGPTRAKTTLDANHALIVLEDALTTGERSLVEAGEGEHVRRQRETFERLMRDEAVAAVEAATGRRVRAVLSDVEPEVGVALQLFLFEPGADRRG